MASPTWSTANLGTLVPGDPPVTLQYFDTHPTPASRQTLPSPYTTLLLVHGTGFNARIFLPLLPHLPPTVRVLAFNRRPYTGSSPAHIPSKPPVIPGNTDAFGRYVLDLVGFVRSAVEKLDVPSVEASSGGGGGLVLLGWSKGCASLIGLLSHLTPPPSSAPTHPLPLPTPLDPYLPALSLLRSLVLLEPPQMIAGLPGPAEYPELRGTPPADLPRAFAALLMSTVPEGKKGLVLEAADKAAGDDLITWNGASSGERRDVCERAFGPGRRVPVGTLYCEGTTIPACVNGAKWINDRLEALDGAGGDQAKWVGKVVRGGDHFVMATDPEALGERLAEVFEELGVGV